MEAILILMVLSMIGPVILAVIALAAFLIKKISERFGENK